MTTTLVFVPYLRVQGRGLESANIIGIKNILDGRIWDCLRFIYTCHKYHRQQLRKMIFFLINKCECLNDKRSSIYSRLECYYLQLSGDAIGLCNLRQISRSLAAQYYTIVPHFISFTLKSINVCNGIYSQCLYYKSVLVPGFIAEVINIVLIATVIVGFLKNFTQ